MIDDLMDAASNDKKKFHLCFIKAATIIMLAFCTQVKICIKKEGSQGLFPLIRNTIAFSKIAVIKYR